VLLTGAPVSAADLSWAGSQWDTDDGLVLLRRLLREGVLVAAEEPG
jgi:hypothetical protein